MGYFDFFLLCGQGKHISWKWVLFSKKWVAYACISGVNLLDLR